LRQLIEPECEERRRESPSLPLLGARARTVAALLFVLGTSACGDRGVDGGPPLDWASSPIIGGLAAEDAEFPAVVSLGGCSGTLVHPRLVVYAEHCGTAISVVRFGAHADAPERVVNVERCRGFPGAKLGDGSDLAYCVLAEPVLDVEPERIMAGCELDDLEEGEPVTIVGFGVDREGGAYGEKRYAASRIESIGDELILESGDADTCRGDSGGPVFVDHVEPDGTVQRRLVGVTSAGSEPECGQGVGHYVNVTAKLEWLESATELDVSPCFSDGSWAPTPACVATTPRLSAADGEPIESDGDDSSPAWLASCGDAFDPAPDEEPPGVEWISPVPPVARYELPADATFVEFELAVDATDVGWGIQRVSFALRDERDDVLFERVDEVAPYGLSTFRLPPGRFALDAEALDFAGNAKSSRVTVQVGDDPLVTADASGGCAASPAGAQRPHWLAVTFAVLAIASRRARRSRRAATLRAARASPRRTGPR
jgi:hypothetical protein